MPGDRLKNKYVLIHALLLPSLEQVLVSKTFLPKLTEYLIILH
jgi:hypothetical protein